MTREEAKEIFLNRGWVKVNGGEIFDGNLWRQSLVVISEWLKEQEPCEDAISRQAILGLPKRKLKNYFGDVIGECIGVSEIKNLPSVTPKQKTGHWIKGECNCPVCGEDKYKDLDADVWSDWQPKFCPNCGAKMESEDKE